MLWQAQFAMYDVNENPNPSAVWQYHYVPQLQNIFISFRGIQLTRHQVTHTLCCNSNIVVYSDILFTKELNMIRYTLILISDTHFLRISVLLHGGIFVGKMIINFTIQQEKIYAFLLELKGHQGQDFAIEFELCNENYMYIFVG